MKRAIVVLPFVALLAAWGGVSSWLWGSPEAGATVPTVAGNYTLTIDASSACQLPISRFTWDVVATSSGSSLGGQRLQVTLPNAGDALDLSLVYVQTWGATGNIVTDLANDGLPVSGSNLTFQTNSSVDGTVTNSRGGRGVLNGTLSGVIKLATQGEDLFHNGSSCIAADHHWTLSPR